LNDTDQFKPFLDQDIIADVEFPCYSISSVAEEPTSNNSNTFTITTTMDREEYFFVLHEAQFRNPGPHYNRGAQIILTQNTKPDSRKIAIYELRNVLIQSIFKSNISRPEQAKWTC
jgi:hypothetical protein